MSYFEKMLPIYLQNSQLKMKITGFDIDGFKKAIQEEGKRRLEIIEQIVFEDSEKIPDAQKVEAIKQCFQKDFYMQETG